jgi:hypothetical protein
MREQDWVHPLWQILSHSRRLPVLAIVNGGTQLHAPTVRDAADRPGAPWTAAVCCVQEGCLLQQGLPEAEVEDQA